MLWRRLLRRYWLRKASPLSRTYCSACTGVVYVVYRCHVCGAQWEWSDEGVRVGVVCVLPLPSNLRVLSTPVDLACLRAQQRDEPTVEAGRGGGTRGRRPASHWLKNPAEKRIENQTLRTVPCGRGNGSRTFGSRIKKGWYATSQPAGLLMRLLKFHTCFFFSNVNDSGRKVNRLADCAHLQKFWAIKHDGEKNK